jgi:GGDEF domain-containing protein
MRTDSPIVSADLERREFQLSLFACSAIVVLAGGLALLMYPAVFANHEASGSRVPQVAFFGFCGLACLLVAYIIERQVTIHRLRVQMAADRKKSAEALMQASADVLSTMPDFNTFEDRLTMEVRRASSSDQKLSVIGVAIQLRPAFAETAVAMSALGDAAKAVSRKLRDLDSLYVLRPGYFGVILPGCDQAAVQRVTGRLAEGLSDSAGANDRFTFKIDSVSYPEQTASAHDLEFVVNSWLPEGDPEQATYKNVPVLK